jgi:acyl dehydratase
MDTEPSTTTPGATPTNRTAVWPRGVPTVGQAAERSRTIGPDDIDTFAAISGDRNPLHYDAEFAASTKLGGIVVQSGLITAIINGAAAEGVSGPGSVFLNTNLDFKAPVRPGDTITGRVEVLEVREDKPIMKIRATVTRQDGVVSVEGTCVSYTFPLPA